MYRILKVSKRVRSSYFSGLESLSRIRLQNHDQRNLAPIFGDIGRERRATEVLDLGMIWVAELPDCVAGSCDASFIGSEGL